MKNLFKNTAKSFFASKMGLFLLIIIIFISAATFTMMHSSANTFKNSYNKVMKDGKAHDFTMDEKYSKNGAFKTVLKENRAYDDARVTFTDSFKEIYTLPEKAFRKPADGHKRPDGKSWANDSDKYLVLNPDEAKMLGFKFSKYTINPMNGKEIVTHQGMLAPIRIDINDLEKQINWKKYSISSNNVLEYKPLSTRKGKIKFQVLKLREQTTDMFLDEKIYSGTQHSGSFPNQPNNTKLENNIINSFNAINKGNNRPDWVYKYNNANYFPMWGQEPTTDTDFSFDHSNSANEIKNLLSTKTNDNYKIEISGDEFIKGLKKLIETDNQDNNKTAIEPTKGFTYYKGFDITELNSFGNGAYSGLGGNNNILKSLPIYDPMTGNLGWRHIPYLRFSTTDKTFMSEHDLTGQVLDNAKLAARGSKEYKILVSKIKSVLDVAAAHEKREKIFKKTAKELNISSLNKYLDYKNIKTLSVTNGNNKYKIVNTLDDDNVDKIVLLKGSMPSNKKDNKHVIVNLIHNIVEEMEGGSVVITNPQYNEVTHEYLGYSHATHAIKVKYIGQASSAKVPSGSWRLWFATGETLDFTVRSDVKYKITASWNQDLMGNIIPHSVSSTDPSSFQIIISSSYAYANNKQVMSTEDAIRDAGDPKGTFSSNSQKYYQDHKSTTLMVGSIPYQIVGIGTTPDFMYPIIDHSSPIPNIKDQVIIYTRDSAFNSFFDSNRSSPQENYLAFKFKDGVSDNMKNKIMKKLNAVAKKSMTLNGFDSINKWDSTSGALNMSAYRMTPLRSIMKTVSSVAWLVPVFLLAIAVVIVIMIIRTKISGMQKQFGILIANGYSKFQVAFTMTSISLIVGLISGSMGYLVGHFLQYPFIHSFDKYWTIPIFGEPFSWLSLLLITAWPVVGIGLFAFITALWEMRLPVTAMLSGSGGKSSGRFAGMITSLFRWMGIKVKLSVSVFGSNLLKMTLSTLGFALAIITSALAFSTMGKFNIAKTKSLQDLHYQYKIDLVSPTSQGGVYRITSPDKIIKTNKPTKPGSPTIPADALYMQTPDSTDADISTLSYLRHRVQMKALFNEFLGATGFGTNPWTTVKAMMPINQVKEADIRNVKFLEYIVLKNYDAYKNKKGDFADISSKESPSYKTLRLLISQLKLDSNELINKKIVHTKDWNKERFVNVPLDAAGGTVKPDDAYVGLVYDGFKSLWKEISNGNEELKDSMPLVLSYGTFLGNDKNERYTHIDIDASLKNNKGKIEAKTISITGIKKDSKSITKQDVWQMVENYKKNHPNSKQIPVVVNSFFEHKYKKGKGDTFNAEISNHKDRTTIGNVKSEFVIVGIDKTYNGIKVLTSQEVANKALGWKVSDNMFNGIFSNSHSPLILSMLNFYSTSGFYPSVDKIYQAADEFNIGGIKYPNTYNQINNFFSDPTHGSDRQLKYGATNAATFIIKYTDTPLSFAYSNVDWYDITEITFSNMSHLSSTIIWVVMSIVLLIAIMFILLLSIMIIDQAKKFISTLKVLGYRDQEIRKIYLGAFILPAILAVLITIPISWFLVQGLETMIVDFGDILVPMQMTGWEIPLAAVITFGIFIMLFILGTRSLKNTSLSQAFA